MALRMGLGSSMIAQREAASVEWRTGHAANAERAGSERLGALRPTFDRAATEGFAVEWQLFDQPPGAQEGPKKS